MYEPYGHCRYSPEELKIRSGRSGWNLRVDDSFTNFKYCLVCADRGNPYKAEHRGGGRSIGIIERHAAATEPRPVYVPFPLEPFSVKCLELETFTVIVKAPFGAVFPR
jgi:hypothetical protein